MRESLPRYLVMIEKRPTVLVRDKEYEFQHKHVWKRYLYRFRTFRTNLKNWFLQKLASIRAASYFMVFDYLKTVLGPLGHVVIGAQKKD